MIVSDRCFLGAQEEAVYLTLSATEYERGGEEAHTNMPTCAHRHTLLNALPLTQQRLSVAVATGFFLVEPRVKRRATGMPLLKELFHYSSSETCKTASIASG